MAKERAFPQKIAVIHLPPLPGSPGADGHLPEQAVYVAGMRAIEEARILTKAGFDGILIENFGDSPFFSASVPPVCTASLSVICAAIRETVKCHLGLNVLRNDAFSALSVASVTGLDFIRVNVLSGVTASDQGLIEGKAAELLRLRSHLRSDVRIFADVLVKHAQSMSHNDLIQATEDTVLRSHADAVIFTGEATGSPLSLEAFSLGVKSAKKVKTPVYAGSGLTPGNVTDYIKSGSGIIVSSTLRKMGHAGRELDPKRITQFVNALQSKVKSKKNRSKKRKKRKR